MTNLSFVAGKKKNSRFRMCMISLFMGIMLCLAPSIYAQRIIKGRVIDGQNQEGLAGSLVIVKNTQDGVHTDLSGNFELRTNEKFPMVLEVRFLGYKPQEISLNDDKHLIVRLQEDRTVLDEVVVVGYGTSTKKDLVGSVSRIGTETLKTTPMNNSLQGALQGKAAGVNVLVSSASPTSPVSVIIRGISSLSGNGQPLWIIDGVPQYSNSVSGDVSNTLYNLNLTDIESIDILKDASSTAIYGSRAANGVVIVTTKSGSEGMKPTIEVSARTGIQKLDANNFAVLNAEEYIRYSKFALREQGFRYGGVDSFMRRYIDQTKFNTLTTSQWSKDVFDDMYLPNAYFSGTDSYWDLMTRDAQTSQYDISLRGGNAQTVYYTSFFFKDQQGVVKGSHGRSFGGRFNFEGKMRDVLKLGVNIDGSARSTDDKDSMIQQILYMRPDYPAYNEDGTINMISSYVKNPLIDLLDKNRNENRSFNSSLFLEYDIFPFLKAKTKGTINYSNSQYNTYQRKYYAEDVSNAKIENKQAYVALWENLLTFFKTWNKHDLQAVAGHSLERNWVEGLVAAGQNFPDDDVLVNLGSAAQRTEIDNLFSANSLLSIFARAQYKFNNRYLLTATYRADASSRFGRDSRWGYFPSGGIGWIVTEEDFASKLNPYLSYLKLRASLGYTGSQNLGNYDWRTLMGSARYNGLPGIVPSSLGNSLLQWEQQKQTDIGIDYGLWNDRVSGSLGWYRKDVDNLLYNKPVPTSSSFTTTKRNIGSIQNTGWEFDVKIKPVVTRDLTWEIDFNIAHNSGILKKINGVDKFFGGGAYENFKIMEGGKLGTFYGYRDAGRFYETAEELFAIRPIDPATGKQTDYRTYFNESMGDIYVVDLNGDGKITIDDREIIGDSNPDFFGGFGSTLYWKGLRLNLAFTYSEGAERYWQRENANGGGTGGLNVYNGIANILNNTWTVKGNGAKYPHVDFYGRGDNGIFTNRFIHDASYLRLSAVNLSYRLPDQWFRDYLIQGIELSFQATNLFTLTNYPGMDPQGNFNTSDIAFYGMGYDFSTYPSAKNFNFGLKFTLK
jgi:TonB-linked SusC/RagA family outer membrane protein